MAVRCKAGCSDASGHGEGSSYLSYDGVEVLGLVEVVAPCELLELSSKVGGRHGEQRSEEVRLPLGGRGGGYVA